ncbi:MAG TPA: endonuclease/exonuclease/phosphatase family protein, partial [Acidimicrobiales bacterium]
VTVVDGLPVTRQANAPYKTSGQWWRDSDGMAHKGVLLVEVDPGEGLPHVEVYSTHLFAGGGWIPGPGHADHIRHHEVRMAEADELVAFVERRHHAGNVVVVCGDMNVARDDVRLDGDQTARFRDLSERFARAGLVDAGQGPGSDTGITSDLPGGLASVPQGHPDDPDRVSSDPSDPAQGPPSNTIDHIFVALDDVATPVTVGPLQRWMFPRDIGTGKPQRLSDHIAVSVELTLSPA